jgi:hypothetical protein
MPRAFVRRMPVARVTADAGRAVDGLLLKRAHRLRGGRDGHRLPFR